MVYRIVQNFIKIIPSCSNSVEVTLPESKSTLGAFIKENFLRQDLLTFLEKPVAMVQNHFLFHDFCYSVFQNLQFRIVSFGNHKDHQFYGYISENNLFHISYFNIFSDEVVPNFLPKFYYSRNINA